MLGERLALICGVALEFGKVERGDPESFMQRDLKFQLVTWRFLAPASFCLTSIYKQLYSFGLLLRSGEAPAL